MSAEPVQVEQDNPKNLLILASVVVVTLGLAVMVVGVNEFFKFAIQEEIQTKQLAVVDPRRVELTSTEKAHLTKYQWVDKSAGVVRIPVERAQELVLKDWAERAAQPASPAVEPAPAPGKKRNEAAMTTSTRHISAALAIFAMVAALSGATARADDAAANDPTNATALPSELRDAGIEANLGGQLPVDVTLVDHDGRQVRFGDYLSDGKPALVVFAYYACPMLCTLVLNGALESFKALPWRVGDQFRVVTISIDERDTPAIAKEKRTNYLRQLGWPVGDRGWDFLTGRAEDVRRLADAAGFHYRWDAAQQQFAHAAGLFVLTPTGIVSRVLYGISFDEKDLRLALTEASGGKIATLTERILLFCFHYEPKTGKYVVAAQQAMKLGGFFTMAVLALVVAYYRRHEKRMRPLDAALRPSVQA